MDYIPIISPFSLDKREDKTSDVATGKLIQLENYIPSNNILKTRLGITNFYTGSPSAGHDAFCCGGYDGAALLDSTETHDGSTWSTVAGGTLATARRLHGAAGLVNAGLCFGGESVINGTIEASTEEFDGTSWSGGGALSVATRRTAGFGKQNLAVMCGGETVAQSGVKESFEYDGTSWAAVGDFSQRRMIHSCQGECETIHGGMATGGYEASKNALDVTEEYLGTTNTWDSGDTMNVERKTHGSHGTNALSMAVFGGINDAESNLDSTEDYDNINFTIGGTLSQTKRNTAGSGAIGTGINFGGYEGSVLGLTEQYDGNSWTTLTSLNTARRHHAGAGD
jgi:hypothetical protein